MRLKGVARVKKNFSTCMIQVYKLHQLPIFIHLLVILYEDVFVESQSFNYFLSEDTTATQTYCFAKLANIFTYFLHIRQMYWIFNALWTYETVANVPSSQLWVFEIV
jgi:hypothetical protein